MLVHGTGVRGEGYRELFQATQGGLASVDRGVELHGCYWADVGGVSLLGGGASIPGYSDTGGGEVGSQDRWLVLTIDPFHELRVVANDRSSTGGDVGVLGRWLGDVRPSAPRRSLFGQVLPGLGWEEARDEVLASSAWARLAATVDRLPDYPAGRAAVRAVVAFAASGSAAVDRLPPSAELERLSSLLFRDAGVAVRGHVGKMAVESVFGLIVERRRGARTDATSEFVGDVVRYQSRGREVRDFIAATIADIGVDSGVAVLGHSLGGIASVEMLVEQAASLDCVEVLVTVGSQAPLLYEMDALSSMRWNEPLPAGFPRWVNVFDRSDLLSYVAAPVFDSQLVTDIEVESTVGFPRSHSAYFEPDSALWRHIGDVFGPG